MTYDVYVSDFSSGKFYMVRNLFAVSKIEAEKFAVDHVIKEIKQPDSYRNFLHVGQVFHVIDCYAVR